MLQRNASSLLYLLMQTTPPSPETLFTVKEAASFLKMSDRWLWKYIRNKIGPDHRRYGRKVRIPYEALLEWASKDHPTPPREGH